MKKHLRILAAFLVLCFSLLCPAAYHSKSTCSNMKDPEKVTLSKAKAEGFTACKKCY